MAINYINGAYVIDNSPVEFMIVGPGGKFRKVLVKSLQAPLDLIGLDGHDNSYGYRKITSRENVNKVSSLAMIFSHSKQKQSVQSSQNFESIDESDTGRTSLSFIWEGFSDASTIRTIGKKFDLASVDIIEAVRRQSTGDIEWQIGHLVYQCAQANDRAKYKRNLIRISLALALLAYVFLGLVSYSKFIYKI